MVNEIKSNIEQIYLFNGEKFAEYIDMKFFKSRIKQELKIDYQSKSLGDIFSDVALKHPNKKHYLNKIFFECIMYNHLKHVYVLKIGESMSLRTLKQRVKKVIVTLNKKDTINTALHDLMTEDGFYLMDSLNVSKLTTKFISGLDYVVDKGKLRQARFLFTEVVQVGERKEYFIAGIDMDFDKNTCLVMIKNKFNILKVDDEQTRVQLDRTINSLYQRTIELVINKLIVTDEINDKKDRESMYELCKNLDEELLKDIREIVNIKTNKNVTSSVKDLMSDLFTSGSKPSKNDKILLEENITSLLIGLYVKTNFKGSQLVRKAKGLKLLGYPTKIKFTSSKETKGATQSASASQPVSSSEMFHSLYISFRDALALEQWSIAWFTDYNFLRQADIDKIQTTIYSKSTNFLIIFKPTRPLDEEIIKHVVTTLNSYRSK